MDELSPLLRPLGRLTTFHSQKILLFLFAWQSYIQLWPNQPSLIPIMVMIIISIAIVVHIHRYFPILLHNHWPSCAIIPLFLLRGRRFPVTKQPPPQNLLINSSFSPKGNSYWTVCLVAEKEELGIIKKEKRNLWNQNNTIHNKDLRIYEFSLVSSASIEESKGFRKFADLVRGLSWRWEASLSEEANLEVIFLRIPALNLAEISGSLTLTHLTRFLFPHCRKSSGSEGCLQALWFLSSVSIPALKTPTHHHENENENFVNWEIPKAKTQKYRTWRILETTTWVFYRNPKKIKSKNQRRRRKFWIFFCWIQWSRSGEEDENIRGIVQKTKLAFMDAQKDP